MFVAYSSDFINDREIWTENQTAMGSAFTFLFTVE